MDRFLNYLKRKNDWVSKTEIAKKAKAVGYSQKDIFFKCEELKNNLRVGVLWINKDVFFKFYDIPNEVLLQLNRSEKLYGFK